MIVLVVIGLVLIYSGLISVAALGARETFIDRMLSEASEHSVKHHARRITAPPLTDPVMLAAGAVRYAGLCVICHGGPGVRRSPIGEGLYPDPPDLAKKLDLQPREVFWIVKNGIRMTGMPSFGRTFDDGQLWSITAVVMKLPALSPADFQRQAPAAMPR
jgi:mono/diheme cytochrome c family protein